MIIGGHDAGIRHELMQGTSYDLTALEPWRQDKTLWRYLRVAKVQDLVKQLIYEHKVAFDALLVELTTKVILEQRHYLHNIADFAGRACYTSWLLAVRC